MRLSEALTGALLPRADLDVLVQHGARIRIQIVGGDPQDYPDARKRSMPGQGHVTLEADDMASIVRPLSAGDGERAANTFIERFAWRYGMTDIWVEDVLDIAIDPVDDAT